MIANKENRCVTTKFKMTNEENNQITKNKINVIKKFSYTKLTAPKISKKSEKTPIYCYDHNASNLSI